jgi:hypothetical protein
MCLLLTLLAVPVFYSLFDDAQESTVWNGIAVRYERFKANNLRPAFARFTGMFGIAKRAKKDETTAAADSDGFAESTSTK